MQHPNRQVFNTSQQIEIVLPIYLLPNLNLTLTLTLWSSATYSVQIQVQTTANQNWAFQVQSKT